MATHFFPHDGIISQNSALGSVSHFSDEEVVESDSEEEKILKKKKYIRANWSPPPQSSSTIREIAVSLFDLVETDELLPIRKVKLCERSLKPGDVVKRMGSKDGQLGYCRNTSVTCCAQVVGTDYVLTNVNATDLRPLKWREWTFWINVFHMVKVIYTASTILNWFHLCTFNEYSLILGNRKCVKMKDSYGVIPLDEWKAKMTAGLKQSPAVLKKSPTRTSIQKLDAFWENIFYYGFAFIWMLTFLLSFYKKFVLTLSISPGLSRLGRVGSFVEFYCLIEICKAIVQSVIRKKIKLKCVVCFYAIYGIVLELGYKLQWNVTFEENKFSEIWNECLGILILCYYLYRTFMILKTVWRKGLPRSLQDNEDLFSGWWESELFLGKMLVTELLNTQTRVEVVWQDGTVEHDIRSVNLHPVKVSWDMHEFFPGDRVLHSNDSVTDVRSYEYGVVKKVDHRRRTAIVIWLKYSSAHFVGENPKLEFLSLQEMSVYDINYHPHFKYFAGINVTGTEDLEPTPLGDANEGDPITTTDQSPLEDHSLLLQGEGNDQEMNGWSDLCTASEEDDTKQEDDLKQEDDTERQDTSGEESLGQGLFLMLDSVPDSHKFKPNIFEPKKLNTFLSKVKKEMDVLKSSLPDGIVVKGFADRIDLYSVMIKGPKMTPYEDGLFFFDFQLPADYPESPPLCHYVSFCAGRLNPNLYEGGRVCVSLLGTWPGKDTEKWNKDTSNLLQVVVSIQGLILVSEPYYNEPTFVQEKGTQLGKENSRLYNEMVMLRLMEAIINLIENPPELFQKEISHHFKTRNLVKRLERWVEISECWNSVRAASSASLSTLDFHGKDVIVVQNEIPLPDFPLMPASKGFCFSLRKSLAKFKNIVASQKS